MSIRVKYVKKLIIEIVSEGITIKKIDNIIFLNILDTSVRFIIFDFQVKK